MSRNSKMAEPLSRSALRGLELKDGTQLSGVGEEAIFANLEVFTQRLASEDARDLHGWHPSDEQNLFRVYVERRDGRQVLVREML